MTILHFCLYVLIADNGSVNWMFQLHTEFGTVVMNLDDTLNGVLAIGHIEGWLCGK